MNKLVSFIIPAYNVGKYLEKCVLSIEKQNYSEIEILIINDGSTDNTLEVSLLLAKQFDNLIVINKENEGVSASRNLGIKKSTGEWIVFVDGDDYLASDFLEHMFHIHNLTGADFCMTTDCYTQRNEEQNKTTKINRKEQIDATLLLLSSQVEVGCWNKMFKRQLLVDNSVFFRTDLFYGEGLYFITMLSQLANCIGVSNKKIYYYRQNNSISATKRFDINKIHNGWKALNEIEYSLKIKNEKILYGIEQHRCLFCLSAMTKMLNANVCSDFEEDYFFYKDYFRHSFMKHFFDKYISNKIRIKMLICYLFPSILSYFSKKSITQRAKKSV